MKIKNFVKVFLFYVIIQSPFFVYGLVVGHGIMFSQDISSSEYIRLFWPGLLLCMLILPFSIGGSIHLFLSILDQKEFLPTATIRFVKSIYLKLFIISIWFCILIATSFYFLGNALLLFFILSIVFLLFNQYLFHTGLTHSREKLLFIYTTSLKMVYNNFPKIFTWTLFLIISIIIFYFITIKFIFIYLSQNELIWKLSYFLWSCLITSLYLFFQTKIFSKLSK